MKKMMKKSLTKAQPGIQVNKKETGKRRVEKTFGTAPGPGDGSTKIFNKKSVYNKEGDLVKSKEKAKVMFGDKLPGRGYSYTLKTKVGKSDKNNDGKLDTTQRISNMRSIKEKNGGSIKKMSKKK